MESFNEKKFRGGKKATLLTPKKKRIIQAHKHLWSDIPVYKI